MRGKEIILLYLKQTRKQINHALTA